METLTGQAAIGFILGYTFAKGFALFSTRDANAPSAAVITCVVAEGSSEELPSSHYQTLRMTLVVLQTQGKVQPIERMRAFETYE